MRKIVALLIAGLFVIGMAGCSSGVPQETVSAKETLQPSTAPEKEQPSDTPILTSTQSPQTELVTYDDILTGNYNGQTVYIDCALSRVEPGVTDYISFIAWVGNGEQYLFDGNWMIFDLDEVDALRCLKDAKSGEVYRFCVQVNSDASFGGSGVLSAEKLGMTVEVSTLEQQYKEGCTEYPCEDILRNPEEFKGVKIRISGEVFQVVSDDGSNLTLLLDTGEDNGIAYIKYNRDKGENRILDGDSVTAYGTFYKLTKYTSVLGTEKTVPELYANFLDISI